MQPDLFATKGVEYILVIFFLLALALFWRWLTVASGVRRPAVARAGAGWFRLSRDCYYHPGHGWTRVDPDGLLTVGIDDFAQHLIGRPERLELPAVGDSLRRDAPGWAVGVAGRDFSVLSPVSGEVVAINQAVLADPGLVNSDPYGSGWLLKLRPVHPATGLRRLLTGSVAAAWFRQAEEELRRRAVPAFGTVMQDGGLPVSGIARSAWPDEWEQIVRDFLLEEERA